MFFLIKCFLDCCKPLINSQSYEKVYGFKFKEYEYKYNKLENQDKNDKFIVNFNMKSTELNWKIHRELFQ